VKINVTDADMREAYLRRHLGDWDALKIEARRIAAARLIKDNQVKQKAVCDWLGSNVPTTTMEQRTAWFKKQDEFDKLCDEHDKLLDAAYPRAAKEATP